MIILWYSTQITSGVTSLGEKPVPPVVKIKWTPSTSAHCKSADYMGEKTKTV